MKKQILFWVSVLSVYFSVSLFAQDDNGQAGGFLRYGVGGRALGMGRAFTAVSDDASGVYWNPAGIMGAKQLEVTSMYSNLFYDSQYAHFGLIIPRPLPHTENPFLRFLLGPSSSVGVGWVGLSMIGFEQRTDFCEYVGDFGLQENALMFSWAKEFIPSWGVLRTGFTMKFAGQDFSGLEAISSSVSSSQNQRNSFGADFGLTFQPIHAPVLNIISLKYLLPLTMGFSIQNLIQPRWNGYAADKFPRSFRLGLSYRWILKDWIPDSWGSFQSAVEDWHLLTAFDRHHTPGQRDGVYAGAELFIPVTNNGISLYPRLGVNNQTDGKSFGLGMELPLTSSALLRIDYAYGAHPYLNGDNRFFLTIKTGKKRDAEFFFDQVSNMDLDRNERIHDLYEVLADYPNDYVPNAVKFLIQEDDSTRIPRYLELAGGILWAESLYRNAKDNIAANKWGSARRKALNAVLEYTEVYNDENQSMSSENMLNYCESLLISGFADSAFSILSALDQESWKLLHLQGVCKVAVQDTNNAENYFKNAVQFLNPEDSTDIDLIEKEDLVSKRALSAMETAMTLIYKKTYAPAIGFLKIAQKNMVRELKPDYLQYPPYADYVLNDDAQFLIGLCLILDDQFTEGIAELQKTDLLYFNHKYGRMASNYTDTFLEMYNNNNNAGMKDEAEKILKTFINERNWLKY